MGSIAATTLVLALVIAPVVLPFRVVSVSSVPVLVPARCVRGDLLVRAVESSLGKDSFARRLPLTSVDADDTDDGNDDAVHRAS